MTDEGAPNRPQEWQEWDVIVAADMADPAFRALVGEIDADQDEWATG